MNRFRALSGPATACLALLVSGSNHTLAQSQEQHRTPPDLQTILRALKDQDSLVRNLDFAYHGTIRSTEAGKALKGAQAPEEVTVLNGKFHLDESDMSYSRSEKSGGKETGKNNGDLETDTVTMQINKTWSRYNGDTAESGNGSSKSYLNTLSDPHNRADALGRYHYGVPLYQLLEPKTTSIDHIEHDPRYGDLIVLKNRVKTGSVVTACVAPSLGYLAIKTMVDVAGDSSTPASQYVLTVTDERRVNGLWMPVTGKFEGYQRPGNEKVLIETGEIKTDSCTVNGTALDPSATASLPTDAPSAGGSAAPSSDDTKSASAPAGGSNQTPSPDKSLSAWQQSNGQSGAWTALAGLLLIGAGTGVCIRKLRKN